MKPLGRRPRAPDALGLEPRPPHLHELGVLHRVSVLGPGPRRAEGSALSNCPRGHGHPAAPSAWARLGLPSLCTAAMEWERRVSVWLCFWSAVWLIRDRGGGTGLGALSCKGPVDVVGLRARLFCGRLSAAPLE